jgi:hypothetical protein
MASRPVGKSRASTGPGTIHQSAPATAAAPLTDEQANELYLSGIAAKRAGDLPAAVATLREALERMSPKSVVRQTVQLALAGYLELNGEKAEAAKVAAEIAAPASDTVAYYGYAQNMAWLSGVRGQPRDVVRWVSRAAATLHHLLAGRQNEELERQLVELKRWVSSEPDLAPYRDVALRYGLGNRTLLDALLDPAAAKYFELASLPAGATLPELVGFARGLVAILAKRECADAEEARTVLVNLHFALATLDQRTTPHGGGPLYDLGQQALRAEGIQGGAALAAVAQQGLDELVRAKGIELPTAAVDASELEATRALLTFASRGRDYEFQLGRMPTIPFDPPDFKKKMANGLAGLADAIGKLAVPASTLGRNALAGAIVELTGVLKRIERLARSEDRPDIAADARAAVQALERMATATTAPS